jgi:hypothetical protein
VSKTPKEARSHPICALVYVVLAQETQTGLNDPRANPTETAFPSSGKIPDDDHVSGSSGNEVQQHTDVWFVWRCLEIARASI